MSLTFLIESTGFLLLAMALGRFCAQPSRRAALGFFAIAALPLLWLADISGLGWQPLTRHTVTLSSSLTPAPLPAGLAWSVLWGLYWVVTAWRLTRWLRAQWLLRALRCQARSCRAPLWHRHSRLLSQAMRQPLIAVHVHPQIGSPFLVGGLNPGIYIPAYLEDCSSDRVRQVLLHEFAHLRAHDWMRSQLIELVCCLLWFQPLLHRVRAGFRRDIELACDEHVLRAGADAFDYAQTLAHCAAQHRHLPAPVLGMAAQRAELVQRVAHILTANPLAAGAGRPWAAALLIGGALLLGSLNLTPRAIVSVMQVQAVLPNLEVATSARVTAAPAADHEIAAPTVTVGTENSQVIIATDATVAPTVSAPQILPSPRTVVDATQLWRSIPAAAASDAEDYATRHSSQDFVSETVDPRFEEGLRKGTQARADNRQRIGRWVWPLLGRVPL